MGLFDRFKGKKTVDWSAAYTAEPKFYGRPDGTPFGAIALTEGTEVQKMDESFWLLSAMMDAGAKYAKVEGISTPPPLSYDALYDLCGMDDLLDMQTKIFETIADGSERRIETEDEEGKNAETTRQNQMSGGASGTD